jgi:predicted SnoaL-like aldol condensation-catalyzing enzyme
MKITWWPPREITSSRHGRFSGHGRPAAWIAADVIRFEDGKFAEHWDVLQDEATKAQSVSGLPMFGDKFPA